MYRSTRILSTAAIATAVFAAGACSGGSDDSTENTKTTVQTTTTTPPSTSTSSSAAASASTPTAPPTATTPTTSSTVATTAATATTPSTDAEVLAAVRAFWDLFIEVGGRAGPFDAAATRSKLAERTTGDELSTLFDFFQGNAAAGYVVRGTIDLAPKVISNDGTTAQVRDCHDDHTGIYRASDGTRIDTDNPARQQVFMTLRRENGVWKVASSINEGDGCAAS